MRAVRSTGDGVEVVDVDEPDGAGELLTMRAASVCGSDLGYIAMGSRFVLGRVPSRQPPTGRHRRPGRWRRGAHPPSSVRLRRLAAGPGQAPQVARISAVVVTLESMASECFTTDRA